MLKIILAAITMIVGHTGLANHTENPADSAKHQKKIGYFLNFGMGAMIGCQECESTGKVASLTTSLVQGVRIGNRWSVGAGIGFDSYDNWKTMPLFGSVTFDLLGKKNKVYVGMDYGYSAAWINNGAKGYGFKSDRGGSMVNPSIGYRIKAGSARLSFNLGYKFQRVYSNYEYYAVDLLVGHSSPPSTTENRIDMNRVVIGMAIGWR